MSITNMLRGTQRESGSRFYGVVVGVVTSIDDPESQGRIKVSFPWLAADDESHWARLCQMMAGNDRGSWFIPEVGDEVLCAFEHGDVNHPFVIGSLYNGQDAPPSENSHSTNNDIRMIKSRNGHIIKFDDASGGGSIEIVSSGGNKVFIDAGGDITVEGANINIKGSQDVNIEGQNVNIKADMKLACEGSTGFSLKTTAMGEVNATGTLTVKGAMVNIN